MSALETAVKAFRMKPQSFNGPLGFSLFEWLDDASRNAVLCANGASTQIAVQLTRGTTDKTASLLRLAQSCSDASSLMETVSENAGALYQRYLHAEDELAKRSVDMLEKCTAMLKANSPKR